MRRKWCERMILDFPQNPGVIYIGKHKISEDCLRENIRGRKDVYGRSVDYIILIYLVRWTIR